MSKTGKTFLFDIDHTLYPYSQGVENWFSEVLDRIVAEELKVTAEHASFLRKDYYGLFGSTLTGLLYYHEINIPRFFKKKGVVPLEYIELEERGLNVIHQKNRRNIAFTNASKRHGERVVNHLGIRDKFETIYGIDCMGYWGKPFRKSFDKVFEQGRIDPEDTVFFEDSPRNLQYPKSRGMVTVLIGESYHKIGQAPNFVDIHTKTLGEAMEATYAL